MKLPISIFLTIMLVGLAGGFYGRAGLFGPSDYDECIIEGMQSVQSDRAADFVAASCFKKFPVQENRTAVEGPASEDWRKLSNISIKIDSENDNSSNNESSLASNEDAEFNERVNRYRETKNLVDLYRASYKNLVIEEGKKLLKFKSESLAFDPMENIEITDPDWISRFRLIHDYAWPDPRFKATANLDEAMRLTMSYVNEFQDEYDDEIFSLLVLTAYNLTIELENYSGAGKLLDILPIDFLESKRELKYLADLSRADIYFLEKDWQSFIDKIFSMEVRPRRQLEIYSKLAYAALSVQSPNLTDANLWALKASIFSTQKSQVGDAYFIQLLERMSVFEKYSSNELFNIALLDQENLEQEFLDYSKLQGFKLYTPLLNDELEDLERILALYNLVNETNPLDLIDIQNDKYPQSFKFKNFSEWNSTTLIDVRPKYPSLYARNYMYGDFYTSFDIDEKGLVDLSTYKLVKFDLFQNEVAVNGPTRFFESEIKNALRKFQFSTLNFRGNDIKRKSVSYKFTFEL